MEKNILKFIFSSFKDAFDFMRPALSNYQEFSKSLSKQIGVKKHKNVQYNFDIELDQLIKNKIKKFGISGKIFSEESGFFESGKDKYRLVYDPFCNSSLASRTFQEAAIGLSIFSYDYKFITSAIMDYQTGITGVVEDGKTIFYQIQSGEKIDFDMPKNKALKDAWIIITLENNKERRYLSRAHEVLNKSKRIIVGSGHIYWLKLAMGFIDAYLDPFGGEKLYEMFACTLAQKNGCVVSDLKGNEFDPVENLKIFEKNQNYIYYPISATNSILHRKILASIQ
jgi:fructose-1,6-bisphosphatase/inositol monophosphatase family enzyme